MGGDRFKGILDHVGIFHQVNPPPGQLTRPIGSTEDIVGFPAPNNQGGRGSVLLSTPNLIPHSPQ